MKLSTLTLRTNSPKRITDQDGCKRASFLLSVMKERSGLIAVWREGSK